MKQIVCVLLVVLGCTSIAAQACRPFGSYQFVEDDAGGIWFTEGDNNAISRMAPDSTVTSYKLPTVNAEPSSLALDHDGNIWFTEMNGDRIGRLNKDGSIVEFPTSGGHPFQVTVDADGEAWFTQMADQKGDGRAGHSGGTGVGRVDRQRQMHFYSVNEGWATSIAFDNRNQAWVSILIPGDKPQGKLVRLSRDGAWRVEASWKNSCPRNLLAGPDGKVHFTDGCRNVAGYRTADGKLVEWKLPAGTNIQQTSLAKDGTLWFTDRKHLGRIDPTGKVSNIERADNGDATMAVLALGNGDVVFSEFYNYNINRLKSTGEFVEHLVSIDERHNSREVKEGEFCRIEFGARIASKAEMDKKRAQEVKSGHLKPDGAGTEKLAEQKCMVCHDTRRLLLSRRSDWTPSITRMHSYRAIRNVEPLTTEETTRLVRYFNTQYGLVP